MPFLLPFVPILRGGNDIDIVKKALYAFCSDPNLADFETFLAFMARFVFDEAVVLSLMRWDMAILRENPWYNEIVQEGIEIGVEQGIELVWKPLLETVARTLEHRFGSASPELLAQIRQLPADDIPDVIDFIYTAPSQQAVANFVEGRLKGQ